MLEPGCYSLDAIVWMLTLELFYNFLRNLGQASNVFLGDFLGSWEIDDGKKQNSTVKSNKRAWVASKEDLSIINNSINHRHGMGP